MKDPDGEQVEIDTHDGDIAPHFNLEELFRGKSPKAWRAVYANVFDWGPDIGREIVDE